jgi:hypothetical protein
MNDGQGSKLNMYRRVLKVLRDHKSVYSNIDGMTEARSKLDKCIIDIRQVTQQQAGTQSQGFTIEKQKAIEKMMQQAIKVVNALYVYAFNQGYQLLLNKVSINKSTFYRRHANDEFSLAENIASEGYNYLPVLSKYGINAAELQELDKAIPVFESHMNNPQIIKEKRSLYTGNL